MFELSGMKEVLGNVDRVVKQMEATAARRALDEQGDRMVEDVVSNTPVVSGAAAGSVRKQGPATPDVVVIEAGGADAPYFPVIEFGGVHNRSPAAPFRRALEKRRMVLVPEVKESIRKSTPELKG